MNVDPSATERSENYKWLRIWSLSFGITTVVVTIAEALVSPTHPSPEPLGWVLIPTAALIGGVGFAFIFSTPLYLVMASGSDAANKRRWLLIRTTICLLFMSCFMTSFVFSIYPYEEGRRGLACSESEDCADAWFKILFQFYGFFFPVLSLILIGVVETAAQVASRVFARRPTPPPAEP